MVHGIEKTINTEQIIFLNVQESDFFSF